MGECNWPFHHDRWCEQCKAFDVKYSENLDAYFKQLEERNVERKKNKP